MTVQLYAKNEAHFPVQMEALSADEAHGFVVGLLKVLKLEQARRRSVREFLFSVRALNVMQRYGLKTVGDLVDLEWTQVLRMERFGMVCIAEVARELTALGFHVTAFHKICIAGSKEKSRGLAA